VITALVLAAGQSRRMGRPKMTLAWRETTVLGRVIQAFHEAGVHEVVVVTGGDVEDVKMIVEAHKARAMFNPDFGREEMLSSLQVGLQSMQDVTTAAMIALGDQPQIQEETILRIAHEYEQTASPLIVPSYQMRRGHPWLVARELWGQILAMHAPQTPRDFLNQQSNAIHYVNVETPTILQDLDTPDDYTRFTVSE
jgi:molybdenum cofactor cytidylyltransferase